jgi:hypothetical protein
MLFESFLVFVMLECLVLITAYILYFKQPIQSEKKIYNPWGFWDKT